MTSLFTPFDLYFSLPSFLILLPPLTFISTYKMSLSSVFFSPVKNFLMSFFFSLKPLQLNKSSLFLFYSALILFFILNFSSVFPYSFPLTSQISIVLFTSLTFWLSLILFSFRYNLLGFLSHTVPEGTPLPLVWFLFLIELVSNLIRPLTLTVRLVANILAGHLLMILLSSLIFSLPYLAFLYASLNIVELAVSLIQAYIFSTMWCLYFSEV